VPLTPAAAVEAIVLEVGVAAAIFTVFFVVFWRRLQSERDRQWEAEWRRLPWRDRLRIARTVSRGQAVADPRQAMLAAGAARNQRRTMEVLPDVWRVHALIGAIFTVLAVVTGELLVLVPGALWLAAAFEMRARARRLVRRLAEAERRNRAGALNPGGSSPRARRPR
jgi:membrane protein implicated in regulation of membrane protease activity